MLFAVFNLRYLPVIDFLPYQKGVKIADKMIIPEGVAADVYETTFIYEKDGKQQEFTLTNYPAKDTTWKFIDQKSVLVKRVTSLRYMISALPDQTEQDITQKILSNQGYTLLMISKKLNEAGKKNLAKGFILGNFCVSNGIDFFVLTASGPEECRELWNRVLLFCSADETTLKTMLRANPGYMLLRDGIIIDKWSFAGCPDKQWFGNLVR